MPLKSGEKELRKGMVKTGANSVYGLGNCADPRPDPRWSFLGHIPSVQLDSLPYMRQIPFYVTVRFLGSFYTLRAHPAGFII
jgi:hypothetical protein